MHTLQAALLNVEDVEQYVKTSAMAVLKQIVSRYPYEDDAGGQSLKSEAAAFGSQLKGELQKRVNNAGVCIVAFNSKFILLPFKSQNIQKLNAHTLFGVVLRHELK